jgi:methionyl aminopeptidase
MSAFQTFSGEELAHIRKGGEILRACLEETAKYVAPGMMTKELDAIAEEFICSHEGAIPAFKGFNGFPATLCISINDEAVHGIPGDRMLKDGDIVSLDGGVIFGGIYTDACITVPVGTVPKETQDFLDATKKALDTVCAMVAPGVRTGDLSWCIQRTVEKEGYSCIRSLTGHGLGTTLHQYPDIPNIGRAGTGPSLPAWCLIAIEPITSMGADTIREGKDGWTICTSDGSLSAHFEHSILVTDTGAEIVA